MDILKAEFDNSDDRYNAQRAIERLASPSVVSTTSYTLWVDDGINKYGSDVIESVRSIILMNGGKIV